MANPRPDSTDDTAGTPFPPRRRRCIRQDRQVLQSDLSADLQITADELDAILRLLGDDLKVFLSES